MVFVNGELHLLAEEASPDFVFKDGSNNGVPAYCRSVTLLLAHKSTTMTC